jgi:hypothetical protein
MVRMKMCAWHVDVWQTRKLTSIAWYNKNCRKKNYFLGIYIYFRKSIYFGDTLKVKVVDYYEIHIFLKIISSKTGKWTNFRRFVKIWSYRSGVYFPTNPYELQINNLKCFAYFDFELAKIFSIKVLLHILQIFTVSFYSTFMVKKVHFIPCTWWIYTDSSYVFGERT